MSGEIKHQKCTKCKSWRIPESFLNEKKRKLKTCQTCRDRDKKYRKNKKENIRKYNNRNDAIFSKKYLNKNFNMDLTDKQCWELQYFIGNTISCCGWEFKRFLDYFQFIHYYKIKPQMWIEWKKKHDEWRTTIKKHGLGQKYHMWVGVEEYKKYKGKMIYRWAYFQDGSERSKWIYYGDNQEEWEKEEKDNEKEHEKEQEKTLE